MIIVPESVQFYWSDAVNMAAINVLAGQSDVPPDLTLAEAERFELAGLAARRVRVDFWCMLRQLRSAVWDDAVKQHLPNARQLTYGEQVEFADEVDELAPPSVEAAWADRLNASVFDLDGIGQLFTSVALDGKDTKAVLSFYLIDNDGECALTNELELGSGWTDDGADRRKTAADRFALEAERTGIDVEPMRAAAREAIRQLASVLI